MPRELKISVGQFSDKGRKETNQDFHGVLIPDEPLLSLKGISIVLADGISTSKVSRWPTRSIRRPAKVNENSVPLATPIRPRPSSPSLRFMERCNSASRGKKPPSANA